MDLNPLFKNLCDEFGLEYLPPPQIGLGERPYNIISDANSENAHFGFKQRKIVLKVKEPAINDLEAANNFVDDIFENIYNEYIKPVNNKDKVMLTLKHEEFNNDIRRPKNCKP